MLVEVPFSPCQTKDRGAVNVGPQIPDSTNLKPRVDASGQPAKSRKQIAFKTPGASGRIHSECSGDEVLRELGGGYLLVATLCTLDRALSVECPAGGSVSSSVAHAHGQNTTRKQKQGGSNSSHAVSFKHVGAAHEVKELLLLLASLLRLGSSVPMVGIIAMSGCHHGMAETTNPPLVSEVDSALAAAAPTALRRRVSIDYGVGVAHQNPYLTSVEAADKRGRASSPIKVAAKSMEAPESLPTSKAGNLISPLLRQKGTVAASTYPSRKGKKPVRWSEPRRPSIDASTLGSIEVEGSRRTGNSRGPTYAEQRDVAMSHSETIDANEMQSSATVRMAPRRSLSSSSGLSPEEIASITAGRPSTFVEGVNGWGFSAHTGGGSTTTQRVPRSEFDKCGGGNFAVLLATRWKRVIHGDDESGFTMLARLALGESLCPHRRTPPEERRWWWEVGSSSSGARSNSRTGDITGGRWWRRADGHRASGSSSSSGMDDKRWQKRGARKAGAAGGASSAGWSEGAGDNLPVEALVVLATEITRDYFLRQVGGAGKMGDRSAGTRAAVGVVPSLAEASKLRSSVHLTKQATSRKMLHNPMG